MGINSNKNNLLEIGLLLFLAMLVSLHAIIMTASCASVCAVRCVPWMGGKRRLHFFFFLFSFVGQPEKELDFCLSCVPEIGTGPQVGVRERGGWNGSRFWGWEGGG